MIPFSTDVFLGLVGQYNMFLWPLHLAAMLLAGLSLYLAARPSARFQAAPMIFLSAAWLCIGTVYFATFFSTLNWAAWLSAALFIVHGLLLAWFGLIRSRLCLQFEHDLAGWTGIAALLVAIVGYPLFGLITGMSLNTLPIVGIAPGPTVLFTWGFLLLLRARVPLMLTIAPTISAFTGAAAGWLMELPADYILLPTALIGLGIILTQRFRPRPGSQNNSG